ncbi:hypothetical protein EBT16_00485 [bacterium]|nr:hypothetical protein [bacterium]
MTKCGKAFNYLKCEYSQRGVPFRWCWLDVSENFRGGSVYIVKKTARKPGSESEDYPRERLYFNCLCVVDEEELISYVAFNLAKNSVPMDSKPYPRLKIYFYSTPHFKVIRDQFVNSIKDDWDLREMTFDDFSSQNEIGGGMDSAFAKLFVISVAFQETVPGEVFIVSDTDIVFYARCTDKILEAIENKHICISKERPDGGMNIGFMAIRNDEVTRRFWMDIHSRMQKKDVPFAQGGGREVDQGLVNALLYGNHYPDMIGSFLPDSFWNWSQGNLNRQIVMHHANCAFGIESKISQFEYVRRFMEESCSSIPASTPAQF